jgi:hypothetical protein
MVPSDWLPAARDGLRRRAIRPVSERLGDKAGREEDSQLRVCAGPGQWQKGKSSPGAGSATHA